MRQRSARAAHTNIARNLIYAPSPSFVFAMTVAIAALFCSPSLAADNEAEAHALSRLITSEVTDLTSARVVSSAELRDALALEANKQVMGCLDSSCIAEIASAMGTSHVLQAQLGKAGETFLLSIQVFNDEAKALSRKVIRGKSVSEIINQVRPRVLVLLDEAHLLGANSREEKGSESRPSLLVLDVQATAGTETPGLSPAVSNTLFYGGVGALVLSGTVLLLAAGTGGWFYYSLFDRNGPQTEVQSRKQLAPFGITGAVVGGVVSLLVGAAGGAMLGTYFVGGNAE